MVAAKFGWAHSHSSRHAKATRSAPGRCWCGWTTARCVPRVTQARAAVTALEAQVRAAASREQQARRDAERFRGLGSEGTVSVSELEAGRTGLSLARDQWRQGPGPGAQPRAPHSPRPRACSRISPSARRLPAPSPRAWADLGEWSAPERRCSPVGRPRPAVSQGITCRRSRLAGCGSDCRRACISMRFRISRVRRPCAYIAAQADSHPRKCRPATSRGEAGVCRQTLPGRPHSRHRLTPDCAMP